MSERKRYKVLHPIALDGVRERGEIIELTEMEASNYPDRLALDVKDVPPVVQEKQVEDMTLPELVEKATALKLVNTGSKADLLERINLSLK